VDGPGHDLLACPALAADQHGCAARRDLCDELQHRPPGGAGSDGIGEAAGIVPWAYPMRDLLPGAVRGAVQEVEMDAHCDEACDDGEHPLIAIEGEGAGRPAALGGEHPQGGAPFAQGQRVHDAPVGVQVPPASATVQEAPLLRQVGDGDGLAVAEDPADDPLPRADARQDPLRVRHLRGSLDEDVAGDWIEERDRSVLQVEVSPEHLQRGGQPLGWIGGERQDSLHLVDRVEGEDGAARIHLPCGEQTGCHAGPTPLASVPVTAPAPRRGGLR
jgi:hypothetical protein